MKASNLFVSILFLFFSYMASAGVHNDIKVSGIVMNYDLKTVRLFWDGNVTNVPRSAIPKTTKLKLGERVDAFLKFNEMKNYKKIIKKWKSAKH